MTTVEFVEYILRSEPKALSCHAEGNALCVGVADDGTKHRNGLAAYFCLVKNEYCPQVTDVFIFEHGTDRVLGRNACGSGEDSGEIN